MQQPPPRKGNYVKFIKNLHAEQLSKLQLKNQHECDLLEDIRQFTIKRSSIEKSYSEALLKISSAYLNKKMPNIPDIKMEGTEEKWNMWSVWRTVLEENEKLARARLAAIEVFQQQIADEAKLLREYKLQINKKSVNQLATVQKELQICVSDVDKTKRSYFDEEHSAHDVRDKARDIEEKLKKKKGSFFQSITSLQKNSARVTSRKEQLEEKSSGARNDYILSLASANAHQNKYFAVDLQTTMTTMENYVYERIADYLTLMGRTELLTCSATQNSFGKIRDQAQQLTREYNLQCCYLFYPVLKQHIQYDFEPCDNDQVRKITIEHESATATLSREAKILASRIVRDNNMIKECSRKLGNCITMRDNGHKVDANDPNGPDLETKMEDFKEMIRKAETEKVKSEACLECLRAGGINVDEWLQEAETLGIQEIPRSASSLSMRTDASGQGENASSDSFYDSDNAEQEIPQVSSSAPAEDELSQSESAPDTTDVDVILEQERQKIEQLTAGWDDPTQVDWGHEEETEIIEPPQATGPIFKCTALYSYTAQNPDELTIVENEQLEVVGEGDGDGWLRARNYRGEEGYVPHNYLDVEHDTPTTDGAPQAHLTNQISFSSVDYTVDNEEQDAYQDSVQSPDQVSVISAPVKPKSTQLYCIALYDYDASAEDELTFEEGQIMKIINQSAHGVDDGWWEGELDGKIGNFPSLVVEECNENGEPLTEPEDESPPQSAPPLFTPPGAPIPVPPNVILDSTNIVITQSDLDQVASKFNFNGAQTIITNKFDIELSKDQQNVYGKQFQGQPVTVMVEEDEEPPIDSQSITKGDVKGSSGNEFGLGVAQIIVTAATPMVEDSEKQFLPADEHDVGEQADSEPINDVKIIKEKEKEKIECEIEFKEEDEYDLETTDVETPIEIVREEFKKMEPAVQAKVKPIEKKKETPTTVTGKRESSKKSSPQQQPPPPPAPKETKPIKPVKPKIIPSPPVVVVEKKPKPEPKPVPEPEPEPQPEPESAVEQMDTQNDNFEENKFEVNFEEAFGCDVEPPKQVVGGRASIPDELAPHQLARLQDLKESNA